ncbi:hypothetical protein EGW08_000715 [Elysia chlorotica]|uniref:BHLH domain-containing protein n=1 Tax=Elysia chlorotica TaxID=188477 RepID=A0A3S1A5Y4_ELYCH|nr:hypothetical protein EGW08_000715 [Elysia chlorotica]
MLPSFYAGDGKAEKLGKRRKGSISSSLPKSPLSSSAQSPSLGAGSLERPHSLPRYVPNSTWQSQHQQHQHQQQQLQQQHQQQQQQLQQQHLQSGPPKMDTGENTMMGGGEDNDQSAASKRAKLEAAESERLLNFATAADEYDASIKRQKIARDPLSHRIIEKRRRDRMNNCLADLSRLIPSSYHKQGQGRIEKTEIIEMATRHIMMLQQKLDELEKMVKEEKPSLPPPPPEEFHCCATKFYMGFKEAQDEVMRFLVEVESINTIDPFCKKIMNHLENANKKFRTKSMHHFGVVPPHQPLVYYPGNPADQTAAGLPPSAVEGNSVVMGAMGSQDESSVEAQQRDHRLRTLLADQQQQQQQKKQQQKQHMASSCSMSSLSMSYCNNSVVPVFSYSSQLSGMSSPPPEPNGISSSGYVSDLSTLEKTSPNGSTSSRENTYKFKHHIQKRFSQEGQGGHHYHRHHHHQGHQPSDTSSNESCRNSKLDQTQVKWKGGKHHKNRHGSSSAGPGSGTTFRDNYSLEGHNRRSNSGSSGADNSSNTNSDEFTSGSSDCKPSLRRRGNSSGTSKITAPKTENGNCSSSSSSSSSSSPPGSSMALPGFILHPQGTHYMPISVHNTNMAHLFDSGSDREHGAPVFHPISIPVHFRRPVISMPNISICTHMSSHRRDRSNKE